MKARRNLIVQVLIAILALGSAIAMSYFYQRERKTSFVSGSKLEENNEALHVIMDPYSYSKINDMCERPGAKVEEKDVELKFAEPKPELDPNTEKMRTTICPWAMGDNISPRPNRLSSRYEQVLSAQLPQKTVLCSLDIQAEALPFTRQDYFVLTLNGRVLATDAEFLFRYLQEESVSLEEGAKMSAYTYDWSRLLGVRTPISDTESPRREYCIGRDISLANCSFTSGQIPKIEIDQKLARWLGSKNFGPNLRFGLVVTGDKDPKDCWHSPLSFKAKIKYVSAE